MAEKYAFTQVYDYSMCYYLPCRKQYVILNYSFFFNFSWVDVKSSYIYVGKCQAYETYENQNLVKICCDGGEMIIVILNSNAVQYMYKTTGNLRIYI